MSSAKGKKITWNPGGTWKWSSSYLYTWGIKAQSLTAIPFLGTNLTITTNYFALVYLINASKNVDEPATLS